MPLMIHLSFLHAKQLLMKLLVETQQTYPNQILPLMLANLILTWCVNPCQVDFTRVGISIQRQIDSHLDKARPETSKIWSCPIFPEEDQKVKVKAFIQQADKRKMTASASMGFVLVATLWW